eukprot:gene4701-6601_t
MSSSHPLFDAFFWIEPTRVDNKSAYTGTKVLWHYPEDVSNISSQFRDIPQFCFPDLEKVKLTRIEKSRVEHFTFTLTGSEGQRVYGICMRSLFVGPTNRLDIGRRTPHCLCIITKYPFFSMFRSLLLQLHAKAILEHIDYPQPIKTRAILELIFHKNLYATNKSGLNQLVKSITLTKTNIPDALKDFNLILPKQGAITYGEVPILPLFDILGVDKFFKLLSAVMCDRRVIFVAEEANTLSNAVLATASMLHPFSWHHIFIPLLPSNLLSFVAAPMPYLIGVRKYLRPRLSKEPLQDVIIVDADTGEMETYGDVQIKDLIGDSGTSLTLASQSLGNMRAKATNMFLGKTSNETSDTAGQQDIMATIIVKLKSSIISTKPGSASLQSMATGLLRGLPGAAKSLEEAKVQWQFDSEKILRDYLTIFFVYLFADMDDFYNPAAAQADGKKNGGKGGKDSFASGDPRALFDLRAFLYRKAQTGDSKNIIDFLQMFTHSQMFERFCDYRAKKIDRSRRLGMGTSNTGTSKQSNESMSDLLASSDVSATDVYEASCSDLISRQLPVTVLNAKQAVLSNGGSSLGTSEGGVGRVDGTNFHTLTLQYTFGGYITNTGNDYDSIFNESETGNSSYEANSTTMKQTLERICLEACRSDAFIRIMNSIEFRLESCVVANCRGNPGTAGLRAVFLLRTLLISGPECVLTHSINLIPLLRSLIHISDNNSNNNTNNNSSSTQTSTSQPQLASQALEFMSVGALVNIHPYASLVLSLIIDNKKLKVQQQFDDIRRELSAISPYLNRGIMNAIDANLAVNSSNRNKIPIKEIFFANNNTSSNNGGFAKLHSSLNSLKITSINPSLVRNTEHHVYEKELDDEDDSPGIAPNNNYKNNHNVSESQLLDLDMFDVNNSSKTNQNNDMSEEEYKYRIINQDTGETTDLRVLDKMRPIPPPTASKPIISPPPMIAPPPKAKKPSRKSFDLFDRKSLEKFDPFGFNAVTSSDKNKQSNTNTGFSPPKNASQSSMFPSHTSNNMNNNNSFNSFSNSNSTFPNNSNNNSNNNNSARQAPMMMPPLNNNNNNGFTQSGFAPPPVNTMNTTPNYHPSQQPPFRGSNMPVNAVRQVQHPAAISVDPFSDLLGDFKTSK